MYSFNSLIRPFFSVPVLAWLALRVSAYGWVPSMGMSFVLSRLRGSLGAYLAVTGVPVKGADLVWVWILVEWFFGCFGVLFVWLCGG